MTCPVCGKAFPCVHSGRNTSALLDHEIFAGEEAVFSPAESPVASGRPRSSAQSQAAELAWRQEVVSRVQQHRARRGRPVDPNAMELDFTADTPHSFGAEPRDCPMPPPPERFHEIVVRSNKVRQEPKIIRFPRTQPAYVPTVEEVRL